MGCIFPQALLPLCPRVEDSRESLFFHGAVAVTYVCNCRHAWFSRSRLQLISSAFKLLPGRLPAGTAKSEFQRTERIIAKNEWTMGNICIIIMKRLDRLGGRNHFRWIGSEVFVDYKILLVDDSVTVQKIITLTFSDEGVDVIAVNNGDEAIHRLRRLRPALVMADIAVPGRNGYEICEFVKTHPEMGGTPVILLVPAFEPFDEDRARRIGADHHLTKPFQSIRTLISVVKNLMDRKAAAEISVAAERPVEPRKPSHNIYNTAELNSK